MFADRLRIMKPQLIFPDPQILFHKSTIIFIPQIHKFYSTNPQLFLFHKSTIIFIPQIQNVYSTNTKNLLFWWNFTLMQNTSSIQKPTIEVIRIWIEFNTFYLFEHDYLKTCEISNIDTDNMSYPSTNIESRWFTDFGTHMNWSRCFQF